MDNRLVPFLVEDWMNEHEEQVEINLGETCVDSLTVAELFELAGKDRQAILELADIRLGYVPIMGSDGLRQAIAHLYESITPDQVIPAHGAIGANAQALQSIFSPGDNLVTFLPTYQQHVSLPRSLGVEVREFWLKAEDDYQPDMNRFKTLVDDKTKLISLANPNNPTGARLNKEQLSDIISIAQSVGAYILVDEVYRGLEEDDEPSIADLYAKGISVGSMSKVFSLAGLRLGWIVTKDQALYQAVLKRRDYDTISCGVLDDYLATMALQARDALMKRNRAIVGKNRDILMNWIDATPGFSCVRPQAGTTALVYYDSNEPSNRFAKRLIEQKSLLVVPGAAFDSEYCFRIGYAYDSKKLQQGLDLIAEALNEE